MSALMVALGGALGALARYGLNAVLQPVMDGRLPVATLVANVFGSALMGVFYVLIVDKAVLPPLWREFLNIGLLGAFTTFSTFSLEALALWQNGHLLLALAYVFGSVILALIGAASGLTLARLF